MTETELWLEINSIKSKVKIIKDFSEELFEQLNEIEKELNKKVFGIS